MFDEIGIQSRAGPPSEGTPRVLQVATFVVGSWPRKKKKVRTAFGKRKRNNNDLLLCGHAIMVAVAVKQRSRRHGYIVVWPCGGSASQISLCTSAAARVLFAHTKEKAKAKADKGRHCLKQRPQTSPDVPRGPATSSDDLADAKRPQAHLNKPSDFKRPPSPWIVFHKGAPNWLHAQPSATCSNALSCTQPIPPKQPRFVFFLAPHWRHLQPQCA